MDDAAIRERLGTLYPALDRAVRILLGLALLSLLFLLEGSARYLGLVGVVPLLTATLRFCPLYAILGVSTCPRQRGGG